MARSARCESRWEADYFVVARRRKSVSARSSSARRRAIRHDENAAEWQHGAMRPGWVGRVEKLLVLDDELRSKIIRQRLQDRSRPGPGYPAKYRIRPSQYE
jgi:hypothetical protein